MAERGIEGARERADGRFAALANGVECGLVREKPCCSVCEVCCGCHFHHAPMALQRVIHVGEVLPVRPRDDGGVVRDRFDGFWPPCGISDPPTNATLAAA